MSPRISRLSAVAALAAVASAATVSVNATKPAEPCAQIAKLTAAGTSEFSSQLGLACLESTPFKSDLAVSFIDEYSKYLQWQSTIEILRNPPVGSLSSTVDLVGGISTIRSRAVANQYKSQYDFDRDLFNLISSANDGHLAIVPCSFAITFKASNSLVSLSTDGVAIPRLYTFSDGELLARGNKDVSPVTLVNGVGAESFVEALSNIEGLQDPDARYNVMLANVPITTAGSESLGSFSRYRSFPGIHEFNLTYANGTQETIPLFAEVSPSAGNFTATTGDELWDAVCAPVPATTGPSSKKLKRDVDVTKVSKRQADSTGLPEPSGYPKPVIRDPFNVMVGYFPEDTSLKDVAVMTVSSFETSGDGIPDDETRTFAIKAQEFVNKAVASGKSKIIIDVTGNPGGTVDSGFALISIFFPNMTIFSATRIRSVPETQYLFETASRATSPDDRQGFQQVGFLISELVQPDQKTGFASDAAFLGPFDTLGVPSTAISAENNFILGNSTSAPINIFGKGGPLNGTEPPYKPEDIIILTDGSCSSTCTIFINHMIPYGVRVVANGGRPQMGPMQGIGGVKGSQVQELSTISLFYGAANQVVQNASTAGKPLFTEKELDAFKDHIPVTLEEFPIRLSTGSVNYRNAFSPFNDQVPTHFIYQPADCRLFYTPATLINPVAKWANVADAIWGKGECAYSVVPPPPILSIHDKPSSKPSSTTATGKKKTQSSAHKALGLLLAMADGLKPQ
ncbi:hypothetical protein M441DRAFT_69586 [Trichoderma asperellum CBS 433.97]|uniref:Uncharacterized protein n=2 Tax=Trichoderma asperellum TaxID=101201 RepID=A0A2T3Z8N6_TRIA4|nr:hypothetical protein M441DRAFT_69586 [Trichoderma asperellum CBS 433.97]PTB41168.1 hypothetical protein M441DRAFT_69586 [Trichoderma asperellum CBS 433.97]